jgi:hypothetical protein
MGRLFDEARLFRLGHAYHHGATDWHTRAHTQLA